MPLIIGVIVVVLLILLGTILSAASNDKSEDDEDYHSQYHSHTPSVSSTQTHLTYNEQKGLFGENQIILILENLVLFVRKPDSFNTCHLLKPFDQYTFIIEKVLKPLNDSGDIIFFDYLNNGRGTSYPKFSTKKLLKMIPEDEENHKYDNKKTHYQGLLYFKGQDSRRSPIIGLYIHSKNKNSQLYSAFASEENQRDSYLDLFKTEFEWNVEDNIESIRIDFLNAVKSIETRVEKVCSIIGTENEKPII